MGIRNIQVNSKLDQIINETARYINSYVAELSKHKQRSPIMDSFANGAEGFKSPGDVYRPYSKFAPIELPSEITGQSLELFLKDRA